ncbi:type IV pilus biogenesis protein PilM [Alkalicoccus urumqiensis]|nr:pilus assembly protein PilM [Alkalicoccus urumqiensis]
MDLHIGGARHALLISDHVIRYARLNGRSANQVVRVEERYLPRGVFSQGEVKEVDTLLTVLQECVEAWKLKGRKVFFSIPDSLSIVRKHTVPLTVDDDDIRGHLYMQLGDQLHLPMEHPVFDWHEISRTEEEREILLFAAPENAVTTLARLLREVRVKPAAADLSPLALYRLYNERNSGELEQEKLILQLAPTYVHASIFSDDLPLIMRTILLDLPEDKWTYPSESGGENDLAWGGTDEEIKRSWRYVIDELGKLLNYYQYTYQQDGEPVSQIVLGGDHPYIKEFRKELKEQLNLPCALFAESDWESKQNQPITTKDYAAIGLALKKEV